MGALATCAFRIVVGLRLHSIAKLTYRNSSTPEASRFSPPIRAELPRLHHKEAETVISHHSDTLQVRTRKNCRTTRQELKPATQRKRSVSSLFIRLCVTSENRWPYSQIPGHMRRLFAAMTVPHKDEQYKARRSIYLHYGWRYSRKWGHSETLRRFVGHWKW
jgi:hypothetical protein